MDNDTIDKAKILSRFAFMQMEPEESAVRHAMSAMEDTVFDWLLLLQEVLMQERMDAVEMVRSLASQIRERGDCIRLKTLAVTGKDLIQAGIQPGPALGKKRCIFSLKRCWRIRLGMRKSGFWLRWKC